MVAPNASAARSFPDGDRRIFASFFCFSSGVEVSAPRTVRAVASVSSTPPAACSYPCAARYRSTLASTPPPYRDQKCRSFTSHRGVGRWFRRGTPRRSFVPGSSRDPGASGGTTSTSSSETGPCGARSASRNTTPIWKSWSCAQAVAEWMETNSSVQSFPRLRVMASAVLTCPALWNPGCVMANAVMSKTRS